MPDELRRLPDGALVEPAVEKSSAEKTTLPPPGEPAPSAQEISVLHSVASNAQKDPFESNGDPASPANRQAASLGNPVTGAPRLNAEQPTIQLLQLPSERLAVEIHHAPNPRGFWPACGRFFRALGKDYGALLTGIASVAATVVLAILALEINRQQAKSLQVQSDAAQEEVNVKFIEEFRKHLSDLTLPEDKQNLTQKTLAAISLAQYGARALPALRMSLAVEDEDIKDGAAVVIVQMLTQTDLRQEVLSKLRDYFDENNSSLRVGVLNCYVTMNRALNEKEFDDAKTKITQYVDPSADYSGKPEEQRVLLEAVNFFSSWPRRNSRDFLLAVARNGTCGDEPREGAINYLPMITISANDLSHLEREASKKEVAGALQQLLPAASDRLKRNITDALAKLQ